MNGVESAALVIGDTALGLGKELRGAILSWFVLDGIEEPKHVPSAGGRG